VSRFDRCETCGEWAFLDRHVCPPSWRVWEPDQGESRYDGARIIYARDAEQAAEKWAALEDWEGAEGNIAMDKHHPQVCVARTGGGEISRFEIRGEMVPEYRSAPIEGLALGEKAEDSAEQDELEAP
jgi:hypothetical protein